MRNCRKMIKHLRSKDSCLGEAEYFIGVIEFQKRGLPHAHLLIYRKDGYGKKFKDDPTLTDKYVKAEESECETDWGKKLVNQHMKHSCGGFCYRGFGTEGRQIWQHKCTDRADCLKQEHPCRKDFPHQINPRTHLHPDTGRVVPRRRTENDRLTVEFNETLLRMWGGHINVKVASTAEIIAYLFAYTFKGNDKTRYALAMEATKSSLLAMREARYLSSPEGCWRLFSYQNAWVIPKVHTVSVTIPYQIGRQRESTRQTLREREKREKSRATWTSRLASGVVLIALRNAKDMTPQEYYEKYKVEDHLPPKQKDKMKEGTDHLPNSNHYWLDNRPSSSKGKPWYVRTYPQGDKIYRYYNLHPSHGAVFYLMLLLKHGVCKPLLTADDTPKKGFEQCLTIEGETYQHL